MLVKKANKGNVRVFTFGIAESLNVPLLDRIAETTKGYSTYVSPGAEIETRISAFFTKIGQPVLTDLRLGFGKVKVKDVYPPDLPDLFCGSQIVAFGRYEGSGATAVTLKGLARGKRTELAYDAEFPEVSVDREFIAHLWARRKIGYLLDQIRLHGSSDELVDEIVRLSKEYGIVTPYTSYLVLEDKEAYRRHDISTRGTLLPSARPEPRAALGGADWYSSGERWTDEGVSGRKAVELSEGLREWKEADAVSDRAAGAPQASISRVGGRTFVNISGVFVDSDYEEGMDVLKLKWGSDAYFAALDAMPELKDYLALGESVVVVIDSKALVVADEGEEDMSADDIKAFFAK